LALVVYALGTFLLFAPIIGDPRTRLGPDLGDPLFNLYVMKWGAHQISLGLPDLWNAPFFHPARGTLALSDHLIGPAAALLALRKLDIPSVAAFNLLFLATFVLGAWTTCWVLRRSGLSWGGALLGGWAFAYSSFRWDASSHYQILRMQWLPPLLWIFDRLLETPSIGRALVFVACYALHVTGGTYLAHLVHLPLLVLLLNRVSLERLRDRRSWMVWAPAAATCVVIAAVLFGPYIGYGTPSRTVDDLRKSGMNFLGFATPAWRSAMRPLAPVSLLAVGRGALYPGLAVSVLAGLALWRAARTFLRPPSESRAGRRLTGVAVAVAGLTATTVGLIRGDRFTVSGGSETGYLFPLALTLSGVTALSLAIRLMRGGPLLRWKEMPAWPRGLLLGAAVALPLCLPMVFWGARFFIPGLGGMRVSSRVYALVSLPLAYLVAVGWDTLRRRGRGGMLSQATALVLSLAVVAEGLPNRQMMMWQSIPDEPEFPPYARFIARSADVQAYVELPPARVLYGEIVAMYFQSLHWRPLVNGYSGYIPPSARELARLLNPLPGLDGVQELQRIGVTHLVVHWKALPWHAGPTRRRALFRRPSFEAAVEQVGGRPVFSDGSTFVYVLDPID
jgi:hypothetical protein